MPLGQLVGLELDLFSRTRAFRTLSLFLSSWLTPQSSSILRGFLQTFFLSGFIEAVPLNYLIFSKYKSQSALYLKWALELKAAVQIEVRRFQ